ncbi:MAG TPA: DUF4143 domain-containing protein [Candidatus Latescibacteria bacterium]|nr:DUF4143 domain-containing protein [Candidatus Latescibacterota bacterium]
MGWLPIVLRPERANWSLWARWCSGGELAPCCFPQLRKGLEQQVDFQEVLVFKGKDRLSALLPEDAFATVLDEGRFYHRDYRRYLLEFLVFGGYPRVALEDNEERKTKFLGEIVSTYVYRDVSSLFQLEDISKFNRLLTVLAAQTGSILNVSNIRNTVGITRQTTSRYISILESTFILSLLPPYFTNPNKEVTKSPKLYFLDNGIRNYPWGI